MEIDLSALNEKQKAKEFKATSKAIKSKELDVRKEALNKVIRQPAYLVEGGCISSILETLVAKKVSFFFSYRQNSINDFSFCILLLERF